MPTTSPDVQSQNELLYLGNLDASKDPMNQDFSAAKPMPWMGWDVGVIDTGMPTSLHRQDTTSSVWSTDIESAGLMEITDYIDPINFDFDGGQFAVDNSAQHGIHQNINTASYNRPGTPKDIISFPRLYPLLTQAEIQCLQAIAMPHLNEPQNSSSAAPFTPRPSSHSQSASPEPQRKKRKRKSINDDTLPADLCQSRKRGHNAIEKRYRTNLNEKINCLRRGVPALNPSESKSGDEGEADAEGDDDDKTTQQKYGKAAILTRALEYIKHLEDTTARLGGEVHNLNVRIGAFEKLTMSGSVIMKSEFNASCEAAVKSETLESIQAEFQLIKPRRKSANMHVPVTRRSSNQASVKKCERDQKSAL